MTNSRKPDWRHVLEEGLLAVLILVVHTGLIFVVLTCAWAVQRYKDYLHVGHVPPTQGELLLDFAIEAAETILVIALLLIGTASAVWTFFKRFKE